MNPTGHIPGHRAARTRAGFSLVELLVTLGLMAAILAAAAPLGLSWLNRVKASEASAQFRGLFTQAKAVAMQNSQGATDETGVAATVCASGTSIFLHAGTPTSCGTGYVWKMEIPGGAGTSLQLAGAGFSCLLLNNVGLAVAGSAGGSTCSSISSYPISYSFSRGGESVGNTLF